MGWIKVGLWVSVWEPDGTAHGWRWMRVPRVAGEHVSSLEGLCSRRGASRYEDGTVTLLR